MYNLVLEYELLDHPYAEESSSHNEKWASIRLKLVDKRNDLIKTIFFIQWDLVPLLERK